MGIIGTIFLGILSVIIIIGIIRIIFNPYNGFINFLMELMLLDWLGDMLGWIFENIGDLLNND